METLYIILIVFFVVIALIVVGSVVFAKHKDGAAETRVSGGLTGIRSISDEERITFKDLEERVPETAIDSMQAYIYIPRAFNLVYAPVILIKYAKDPWWHYLGKGLDTPQPLFLRDVKAYKDKDNMSGLTAASRKLAEEQWKKLHKEFIKPFYLEDMPYLNKWWYKGDKKKLEQFYKNIDTIEVPGKPGSYQKALYLNTLKANNYLIKIFNSVLIEGSKR